VFYILCPASSLMDVPGYVNPDKLMYVKSDLSAGNGAKLPPNNSGTQGIAEQQYIASMQTGQDKQQTNSRSPRGSQMTMQGQCTEFRPPLRAWRLKPTKAKETCPSPDSSIADALRTSHTAPHAFDCGTTFVIDAPPEATVHVRLLVSALETDCRVLAFRIACKVQSPFGDSSTSRWHGMLPSLRTSFFTLKSFIQGVRSVSQ